MKMMVFKPLHYEGIDFLEMCRSYEMLGFKVDQHYLVLGEIENMPGHLAVVNDRGTIVPGMHDENFAEEDASTTVYTSDDDFEDE